MLNGRRLKKTSLLFFALNTRYSLIFTLSIDLQLHG